MGGEHFNVEIKLENAWETGSAGHQRDHLQCDAQVLQVSHSFQLLCKDVKRSLCGVES